MGGPDPTASPAIVSLTLASGPAATLNGTTSVTAVAGVATFADLSINTAGAGYSLAASSAGLAGATSSTFAIAPAADAALVFTSQPANAAAGQAISTVRVQIQDAYGNPTASTATVSVALASGPPATLNGTTSVAAVAGVATFSVLSIAQAGAGYTLSASSGTLTGATSSAFAILPGAATRIAFVVQPTTAAVDVAIAPAPQVAIQDAYGNTVTTAPSSSIVMSIGTNPTGATLSGTLTQSTASGIATFPDLSLDLAGAGYTLLATSVTYGTATSNAFAVTSGGGLVYTDPAAGGTIRLVVNTALTTPTTVVLDLVAAVPLTAYSVGMNLPLDTTRAQANATLLTPGTALPAGSAPIAAAAVIPTTGPLAGVLVTGQSQKAAGAGAVTTDSSVAIGALLYRLRLDAVAGAPAGVVFDGAALGPKFRAAMRDKLGTDVATTADFRIGRLELF